MKQAQQMQKEMSVVQETLEELVVEGVAGDGLVKVKMDGKQKLLEIDNDPAVQHEELDLLEDLILIAVNQAVVKSQDKVQNRINEITGSILGNIQLPGI
jgi:DNA-binding YbaB/EbfC family protein|tara:strand:- start:188 stop:484 length:297 start_codon:yes stop_codon:yes gene_type:complete